MLKLHFATNGIMNINLDGLVLGKHLKEPEENIKSYTCENNQISLTTQEMDEFTDYGIVELKPIVKKVGKVTVSIDSEHWGWCGTAKIMIEKDGEVIFNDSLDSGLKGPIGNPLRSKEYPIT